MALKVLLFMTYSPRVLSDGRFHGTDLFATADVSCTAFLEWVTLIIRKLCLWHRGKDVSLQGRL